MPFNKTSIFVSTETHTEINCVCPDCGNEFKFYLPNHMVADPIEKNRHEATTNCTYCHEESINCDDEDEIEDN